MLFDGMTAKEIAISGARKASSLITPSGKFIYKYKGNEILSGYNLLRHCGTAWAIADVARSYGNLDNLANAADLAMAWLARKHAFPAPSGFAIADKKMSAKLGGAGLAILAITTLAKIGFSQHRLGLASQLGEFILFCSRENGGFVHLINIRTGVADSFQSDYYTGQALFGLISLFEETHKNQYLVAAKKTISILDASDYGVSNNSHWMVYALSSLHRLQPDPRLINYAGRIVHNILKTPLYRTRKRSAPSACCVEAMAAYLDMIQRDRISLDLPSFDQVMEAMKTDLLEIIQCRLSDGAFVGGAEDSTVQIDYIQHCVSAFLGYDRNLNRQ